MKKLLLYIITCFGLTSFAQTFNQSNHAPMDGYIYTSFDVDTTGILPGSSGTGVTWNFSTINTYTTSNTFTTSTNSNSTFASANFSVASTGGNTTFYSSSPFELKLYGGTTVINGVSAQFVYTSPAKLASYPMNPNAVVTSTTSGNINPTGTFNGNCRVDYDGTGTLVLPARTFTNVSRIKTVQTYTYNAPFVFNGDVKTETYDYYSINESRIPLFSISTTTVNHTQIAITPTVITNQVTKFVTLQKDYQFVSVNELSKENISVKTFPNPATNAVNITTESTNATKLVFTDIAGKVLCSDVFKNGKVELNTSNYSSGTYIYQIYNKENQIIYSDKINISR